MMRSLVAFTAAWVLVAQVARADSKTECIASADQAQQARDDGKYRAARDGFLSCSRAVCPKVVAGSCTKWAREMAEGIPTIVLSAKDAAGTDIGDARVTFDGALLATTLDGKPLEVDPGSHKLRFEHEGSEPVEQTVVIKAGEKLRAVNVVLRASAPVAKETVMHDAQPTEKKTDGNAGRTVTTAVLGVLAAGGLAGGVALAFASQGDASSAAALRLTMPTNACVGAGGASAPCQSLANAVDAENRDGAISVAMYVVGGVLAAAAIITWFAWPKPNKSEGVTARLLIGPAFGGIGGTF
jgi:hypothetical protein